MLSRATGGCWCVRAELADADRLSNSIHVSFSAGIFCLHPNLHFFSKHFSLTPDLICYPHHYYSQPSFFSSLFTISILHLHGISALFSIRASLRFSSICFYSVPLCMRKVCWRSFNYRKRFCLSVFDPSWTFLCYFHRTPSALYFVSSCFQAIKVADSWHSTPLTSRELS